MSAIPHRVVALGGGTGLPSVLRGFKEVLREESRDALTAIVTMTDDGGSSGRLRRGLGLLPPGDLRNCMVALAEEEGLFSALFQHRFQDETELGGHTLGNLILAALAEHTGSFHKAVEVSAEVLRIRGRILPATLDDVVLQADLVDGGMVTGESRIGDCQRAIRRIRLVPDAAHATPGVIESILEADLVVIGPGSLYTSIIPNLLVEGVSEALRKTQAIKLFVGNLVNEPGEVSGLDGKDHIRAIERHAGGPILDGVVVHQGTIDAARLERYLGEGLRPLAWGEERHLGLPIHGAPLLAEGEKLRHDPQATARAVLEAWSKRQLERSASWSK